MYCFTRRTFLCFSAATAASLALSSCQPVQLPTPAPAGLPAQEPTGPEAPPLEQLSLLDAETQTKLEKMIHYLMDSNKVPGLAVGIVKDGQPICVQGFGVAAVGTDRPITPQSVFQIMDTTHLFTVAAAMQLVEQGKLDLDAPIVEYLPYFRLADERYVQITTRHLLAEMAGLPLTPEATPNLDWKDKTPQTDDEALERYVRSLSDTQMVTDPGDSYGYWMCNMGYDIAGAVIAEVAGQPYEEVVRQHILIPLGMAHSTYYPEQIDPALRVTPHVVRRLAEQSDLATWSRERSPSVGLFCDLTDMLRWVQANLNRGELDGRRILQDSSYDEIWRPQVQLDWEEDVESRGLGWLLGAHGGCSVRHYLANDVGFHNALYLAPDANAAVVALGNLWTSHPSTLFYARILAPMALDLAALA